MPFDYYCTYCGRKINYNEVLYDMQMLLTGNEKTEMNILKFRLTKAELEGLFNMGIPTDKGFRNCTISLDWLANIISNKNNLNDPAIKNLSASDIFNYCEERETAAKPKNKSQPFTVFSEEKKVDDEEEKAQEPKMRAPEFSEAIPAIERKDTRNANASYTKENLKKDFSHLIGRLVVTNGETAVATGYSFDISLLTEQDVEGNPVLYGYVLKVGTTETEQRSARVCPYCSGEERIFEHAGTAKHRTVTFIGDQKAGKTCAILALTHYAERSLTTTAMSTDPIWAGSEYIPTVSNVQPLSQVERLKEDLRLYGKGIAPQKTQAENRYDAYSASFRITNKNLNDGYLLTLTDLPGELCNDDGSLKRNEIRNKFQIALACDVFVLCFDTSVKNDLATINKVCSWANAFQEMRAEYKQKTENESSQQGSYGNYAPMMVLFTKCKELEDNPDPNMRVAPLNIMDRIASTYTFRDERRYIEANEVCRLVGQRINDYDKLRTVYRARLRCSPYGFPAPNETTMEKDKNANKDANGNIVYPRPQNIAKLMRWILSVSGCIATGATYRPSPSEDSKQILEADYNFIRRPQYLPQCPKGEGKNGDILEALSRCFLFENPGKYDKLLVQNYDQPWILRWHRFKKRYDSNVLDAKRNG